VSYSLQWLANEAKDNDDAEIVQCASYHARI
jgi:hypothetical protein